MKYRTKITNDLWGRMSVNEETDTFMVVHRLLTRTEELKSASRQNNPCQVDSPNNFQKHFHWVHLETVGKIKQLSRSTMIHPVYTHICRYYIHIIITYNIHKCIIMPISRSLFGEYEPFVA